MPSTGRESIVTVSHRATVLLLASVATLQLWLTWVGLPAWVCPLRTATGIPCPGCGLSRALVALLHGHAADAVALHPFAPLVLAAGLGAMVAWTACIILTLILQGVVGASMMRSFGS